MTDFPYRLENSVFSCQFQNLTLLDDQGKTFDVSIPLEQNKNTKPKPKSKSYIDLTKLTKFPYVTYNPSRFPGAIVRFEDSPYQFKTTVLLFSTTRCIFTGLSSIDQMKVAVQHLTTFLALNNITAKNPSYQIVNIVATSKIGSSIDLNRAVVSLRNALYEPEIFPGLIFRHKNPNPQPNMYERAVLLIFMSGECVCTGIDRVDQISLVLQNVQKEIRLHDLDYSPNGEFEPEPTLKSPDSTPKMNFSFSEDDD